VIDALWYTVVAMLLSRPAWSGRFMLHGGLLDRGFGVILIVLSAAVLWSIWQPL
jgi:threonine/homoserine/homoserine lactone efflux protein